MPDGSIEEYKARLVAKSFSQKQNVNYLTHLLLLLGFFFIRILIVLAFIHRLFIHQMNVKTTFLNGDLEEEIYILQPDCCITFGQAPKQWYKKFDNALLKNGFYLLKCINVYIQSVCR